MIKQIDKIIVAPNIKTIIFDFDGVLCHDRFYSSLENSHPDIHNYIEDKIFRGQNDLVNQWMCNEITSDNINRMISKNNNIEFSLVKKIFEEDVISMKIDQELLGFAKKQSELGKNVALVTNNMDVFTSITVPNHKLDTIFKVIINSADHGLLKTDQGGKLFDIALKKIGQTDYSSTLLIDDSLKVKKVFEDKGGHVFTYTNFDSFFNNFKRKKPSEEGCILRR